MAHGSFSQPGPWRPAVGARLARTLGIRNSSVGAASRKCACRRELNSHEAAKPRVPVRVMRQHEEAEQHAGANSRISVRAGVSAGQPKHTRRPPESATGFTDALQRVGQRPDEQVKGQRCSASSALARSWHQEFKLVVRAARRRAPCKVSGACRRRGVPRLVLPWRGAGSRIPRMQMHSGRPAARTDA